MTKRSKIETLLIATMMALLIIGAQAGTRMHPVAESRVAHQARPDFWRSACVVDTLSNATVAQELMRRRRVHLGPLSMPRWSG
jgi:hypothetical protein